MNFILGTSLAAPPVRQHGVVPIALHDEGLRHRRARHGDIVLRVAAGP